LRLGVSQRLQQPAAARHRELDTAYFTRLVLNWK
jgi:hypothetical protein